MQLVSPLITSGDDTQLCFSFWYAAFGAGDSAVMQIIRQDNSSGESITDKVQLFYESEGNIAGRLISQSVVVDVTVRSVNLNFTRVNKLGMTITKFYTDSFAMHVKEIRRCLQHSCNQIQSPFFFLIKLLLKYDFHILH